MNIASRAYRSKVREERAEETRTRILDATLRVLARGVAEVSIPAIAREAGVSVPTVYRIFGSKRDLLEAIYAHAVHRANALPLAEPTSMAEFNDSLRSMFDRAEAFDDVARAAMAGAAADEVRHATMDYRLAVTSRIVDTIAPGLGGGERDRIIRVLIVLTLSGSMRMWRDHLGASVDVAADDIERTIRALIGAARGEVGP